MKVVITGASGLLGGNLAEALVHAGHEVTATRRPGSKVAHLRHLHLRWVTAELSDVPSLRTAFAGADAVFHCAAMASVLPRETPALIAANVHGTANVLAALGTARLVHCSSAVTIGLTTTSAPCNEDSSWNLADEGLDDGYARTKWRAEQLVLDAAAQGADAVVVNPTFMFGPYDVRPSSGRMIVEVARGRAWVYPPGVNDFVDARDVARGMILAMNRGESGLRYILSGEGMSYREIFSRIATIVGARPPLLPVGRRLAAPVGWWGDLVQGLTGREQAITTTTLRWSATTRYRFTSQRASAQLGYAPGSVDDGIRAAWDWLQTGQPPHAAHRSPA